MKIDVLILLMSFMLINIGCSFFNRFNLQSKQNNTYKELSIDSTSFDEFIPFIQIPIRKTKLIVLDSADIQILKNFEKEMETRLGEEGSHLRISKEQLFRTQVAKKKKHISNARTQYHQKHLILNRLVKIEATDRLLNIQSYRTVSSRLERNKSGLYFEVQSFFPHNENIKTLTKDAIKISKTFTQSLLRYCQISNNKLNGEVTIEIEAPNAEILSRRIESDIALLNIPYFIHKRQNSYVNVKISLIANNFFKKELKEWNALEQKLNLEIRILERNITKLESN